MPRDTTADPTCPGISSILRLEKNLSIPLWPLASSPTSRSKGGQRTVQKGVHPSCVLKRTELEAAQRRCDKGNVESTLERTGELGGQLKKNKTKTKPLQRVFDNMRCACLCVR